MISARAASVTNVHTSQYDERSDSSSSETSVEIDLDDLVDHSTPTRYNGKSHGASSSFSSRHQLGLGGPNTLWESETTSGKQEQQAAFAPRHRQTSSLAAAAKASADHPSHVRISSARHRKSTSLYGSLYKSTLSGFLVRSYRRASLGEKLIKLLFLDCILVFASALCGIGQGARTARERTHVNVHGQPSLLYTKVGKEEVPGTALLRERQLRELQDAEGNSPEAHLHRVARIAIQQQEYAFPAEDVEQSVEDQQEASTVDIPFTDEASQADQAVLDADQEGGSVEREMTAEDVSATEAAVDAAESKLEAGNADNMEHSVAQDEQAIVDQGRVRKPALALRRAAPLAARRGGNRPASGKLDHDEDIFEQHLAAKADK